MSDVPHASVPGSAGSAVPGATKALIQLTPGQYYARLAGAFVVGAAAGAIVGVLVGGAAILTVEPPIKVRGGGLDIEIDSTGSEYWEEHGGDFRMISVGEPPSEYNFSIALAGSCTAPPAKVKEVTLHYTNSSSDDVTLKAKKAWYESKKKTRVESKGQFKADSNNDKRLSYSGQDMGITVTAKPGNGPKWECKFEAGTFTDLCLYTTRKCSP